MAVHAIGDGPTDRGWVRCEADEDPTPATDEELLAVVASDSATKRQRELARTALSRRGLCPSGGWTA